VSAEDPAISERMTCECMLTVQLYQSVSLAAIISVTSVIFPLHKGNTSLDAGNITAHCRHWVNAVTSEQFLNAAACIL